MSDMGLLEAQARGGIEGVNAYAEAQAEVARRRKAAVDAAVAAATGRGAPQAAIDEITAATGQPFDMAQNAMTQQSANFDADAARRTGRWNAYARDVQATRGLVGEQAASRASIIDADTKAKLALLEAQQRASSRGSGGGGRGGGGGGGGGSNTSDAKKPTQTELTAYLQQVALANLDGRRAAGQQRVNDFGEARRFANQSRNMADSLRNRAIGGAAGTIADRVAANRTAAVRQASLNNAAALRRNAVPMLTQSRPVGAPEGNIDLVVRSGQSSGPSYISPRQQAMNMEARQMQQLANRLDASRPAAPVTPMLPGVTPSDVARTASPFRLAGPRVARFNEDDLAAAYDSSPEGRRRAAARAALEKQIIEGLRREAQSAQVGRQMIADFSDPLAFQQEQVNVATSDPVLSQLIDQFDLAGSLDMSGESAASLLDQMRGGPQAREAEQLQQQAALDAQKTDEQRQRDQLSNMLGVDVEQLATATKVPVQALSSLLLNSDVQQALNMAGQVAMTVQDDDLYNADIRAIMAAASSDDVRRLIRVYADLLR